MLSLFAISNSLENFINKNEYFKPSKDGAASTVLSNDNLSFFNSSKFLINIILPLLRARNY